MLNTIKKINDLKIVRVKLFTIRMDHTIVAEDNFLIDIEKLLKFIHQSKNESKKLKGGEKT